MKKNAVALVLGMGQNGLGVTRSLGRRGISVVGVDSERDAPGLKSKYCRPLLIPDPSVETNAALRILLHCGRAFREKSIVYPTTDEYVMFVSRLRNELSTHFRFAIPSQSVVESIVNKRKQYELAHRLGISIPETCYPQSMEEVKHIKNTIQYPALVKPYYSHVWAKRFRNKGILVENPKQLVNTYKDTFDAGLEAMTQTLIKGPITNCISVAVYVPKHNEVAVAFASRKVRQYPIILGVGTCVESIMAEGAVRIAKKFVMKIGYHGIGEVEFKKDDEDGEYRLLELNARTWNQNALSSEAGIDFPLIQYLDLTRQTLEDPSSYRSRVIWLDALQDLRALHQLLRTRQISFSGWLRSVIETDCHAYYASDDAIPLFRHYVNTFSKWLKEHRFGEAR
jgi:D-aspartate ligase